MSKNQKIKLGVLVTFIVIGALFIFTFKKNPKAIAVSDAPVTTSPDAMVNPDVNLSKIPEEAATVQNTNASKDGLCQSLRSNYMNIDEVKRVEKIDQRFINVHKKVDGIVYRLRFFYKDSSENEIPTYLVYKENQNDEDILTEKSPYKKGKLYIKIEKAQGEIIYTEEGLNIGKDQDLFLHFENKVLKDLQGVSPLRGEKDFIECRF